MIEITLYHYINKEKYNRIIQSFLLVPTAPFNSKIPEVRWNDYVKQFSFPISQYYTCCFFEKEPSSWKEYGLFDLLMKEFSGGDYLLELCVNDSSTNPILVRDHSFHSPKIYDMSPSTWKKREKRDSRPELRDAWYKSTIPLKDYKFDFICPEVLIPFPISIDNILFLGDNGG